MLGFIFREVSGTFLTGGIEDIHRRHFRGFKGKRFAPVWVLLFPGNKKISAEPAVYSHIY